MLLHRRLTSLLVVTAFAALAACSGSSGGSGPTFTPPSTNPGGGGTPTPSPSPVPTSNSTNTISSPPIGVSAAILHAAPNVQNGSASWYTGGVTAWSSNAGATSTGANGSNTVDGISCTQMGEPSTNTQLHVHAFVGLYNNGTEEALASAVGMKNPTQPSPSTAEVPSASCFYHMHTHDYSGLVHIEDSSLTQSTSNSPSYATLRNFFDLWGEPISANAVASFSGTVAIYIGKPSGTASNGADLVTSYTPFNGDLRTIKLSHHEAVWIVVGTAPAAGLPQVEFNIEN
jgi:hypothetical protein